MTASNLDSFAKELTDRCDGACELCRATENLEVVAVPPIQDPSCDQCVMICGDCRSQFQGKQDLQEKYWHCLNDSAWSQVPAVQVVAWRLLKRLSKHAWADELFGQLYLDEDTMNWASAVEDFADDDPITVDSNGTRLNDGDTVHVIKDLDVKGTGFVAKRGTVVKGIRLTSNPEHVEGRVNKTAIVLKTCFLKKSV